jgi:pimeloyl-ACP methyl ester carboxylesterase
MRGTVVLALGLAAATGLLAASVMTAASPSSSSPAWRSGPFNVDVREERVPGRRTTFEARVFYPAVLGTGAVGLPPAPVADGRFPVVVFGHGYLAPVESYDSTLRRLAAWGFIVAAPRAAGDSYPGHDRFADDLRATVDRMEVLDLEPGGWLAGHVLRGAYGLAGHSMGGGVSLIAAARSPGILAVATLAATETVPSAGAASAAIDAPVLFIGGDEDAISPVASRQWALFDAKAQGPAQLRVLRGASHCGFLDDAAFLGLGCDAGSMDPGLQRALAARLVVFWMRRYLQGELTLDPLLWHGDPDPLMVVATKGV